MQDLKIFWIMKLKELLVVAAVTPFVFAVVYVWFAITEPLHLSWWWDFFAAFVFWRVVTTLISELVMVKLNDLFGATITWHGWTLHLRAIGLLKLARTKQAFTMKPLYRALLDAAAVVTALPHHQPSPSFQTTTWLLTDETIKVARADGFTVTRKRYPRQVWALPISLVERLAETLLELPVYILAKRSVHGSSRIFCRPRYDIRWTRETVFTRKVQPATTKNLAL